MMRSPLIGLDGNRSRPYTHTHSPIFRDALKRIHPYFVGTPQRCVRSPEVGDRAGRTVGASLRNVIGPRLVFYATRSTSSACFSSAIITLAAAPATAFALATRAAATASATGARGATRATRTTRYLFLVYRYLNSRAAFEHYLHR